MPKHDRECSFSANPTDVKFWAKDFQARKFIVRHENTWYTGLRGVIMEKQNITLGLPKDVLKRGKVMAAEQGTSVSALMERLLQEHLTRHEGYEQARHRQAALLARGFDLGTKGKRSWTREELHER